MQGARFAKAHVLASRQGLRSRAGGMGLRTTQHPRQAITKPGPIISGFAVNQQNVLTHSAGRKGINRDCAHPFRARLGACLAPPSQCPQARISQNQCARDWPETPARSPAPSPIIISITLCSNLSLSILGTLLKREGMQGCQACRKSNMCDPCSRTKATEQWFPSISARDPLLKMISVHDPPEVTSSIWM